MDIKQAKAKLDSVSKSTGTKHHKVLISELCSIVGFLIGEIEKINTPIFTTLEVVQTDLPPRVDSDPISKTIPKPPPPPPNETITKGNPPVEIPPMLPSAPYKTPPIANPIKRYRRGNAGEAK